MDKTNLLQKATMWICVALLIFYAFPYTASTMVAGQESSWAFMMNFAIERGWKFGRDLFFPYGPLNFLITPYNIGNQLYWSIAIYTMLYALYGYMVIALVKQKAQNTVNAILLIIACLLIEPHAITGEIFIIQVMMLMMYWIYYRQSSLMAVFYAILTAMIFHVKILEFYVAVSMLLVYLAFAIKYRHSLKIVLLMVLSLPLTIVSYLIYNPSLYDFLQLLVGAYEISQGQTIDHSYSFESFYEWTWIFVPLFLVFWSGSLYYLFKADKESVPLYLILSTTLYFFFKEGFVRHGGYQCFLGFALFLTTLILTVNFDKFTNFKTKLLCSASVMVAISLGYSYFTQGIVNRWDLRSTDLDQILLSNYTDTVSRISEDEYVNKGNIYALSQTLTDKLKRYNFQAPNRVIDLFHTFDEYKSAFADHGQKLAKLDGNAKSVISNSSFTEYSGELTYAYHDKSFKIMPGVQIHNSYTPWLDKKNYDFLMGKDAPEYIIYKDTSTDDRYVNIEVPATFLALKLNYELTNYSVTGFYDYGLKYPAKLFKKKNKPSGYIASKEPFKEETISKYDFVKIPKDADYMSVEYTSTLKTLLAKLFWKVPEIQLTSYFPNKKKEDYLTGNIVIDNLSTPIEINDLAYKLQYFDKSKNYFYGVKDQKLKYIKFSGKGLDYIGNIKLKWYKKELYK